MRSLFRYIVRGFGNRLGVIAAVAVVGACSVMTRSCECAPGAVCTVLGSR